MLLSFQPEKRKGADISRPDHNCIFFLIMSMFKADTNEPHLLKKISSATIDQEGGYHMGTAIKDLSVEELQTLISNTVRETMEDVIEDMIALSSESFLRSIDQSRRDYKKGRVKPFEEVFNV
jgi:hypothetical protein